MKLVSLFLVVIFYSQNSFSYERNNKSFAYNTKAISIAYSERGGELGMTKAEFEETLIKYSAYLDDESPNLAAASKYSLVATAAVAELHRYGSVDQNTRTTLSSAANFAKAELSNFVGVSVDKLDKFQSVANYVQYLHRGNKYDNALPSADFDVGTYDKNPDGDEHIVIICDAVCQGSGSLLVGWTIGAMAFDNGASCSFFGGCSTLTVDWGNGHTSQYVYGKISNSPYASHVSGPKLNDDGQFDYEN